MYVKTIFACMIAMSAHADWHPKKPIRDEVECLAENIYFEARNQGTDGQWAIAHVTWNRVMSSQYPDSICEVVWEKNRTRSGRWVAQFSWTLDGKSDVPKNVKAFEKAKDIAWDLLTKKPQDNTHGATHYHAKYVMPRWAKKLKVLSTVDDHIFYK